MVVLDTATRRGLVDSAYNERRTQCESAAAFFDVPALRDVGLELFERHGADLGRAARTPGPARDHRKRPHAPGRRGHARAASSARWAC